MTDRLSLNFRVPYYGGGTDGRMKIGALPQFFQEAAAVHADGLGVGVAYLRERGLTWVMRRYRINVLRPLRASDVSVATWYEPKKNLFSVRRFEAFSGGEKLAEAWTGWIVVDLENGRPLRLDRALPKAYYDNAGHLEPDELPHVERPGDSGGEYMYSVRRGELDVNGHVNHTVCFDWVTESIPDEVFGDCEPAVLDAEYMLSIPRTDVTVRTERQPGELLRFLHSVVIRETGKEAVRLSTEWRRKDFGELK
ncbi:hypothetical protein FACS1894216_00570 [Synergistales bacterium]|nr:hypothetical protein FACS1894216_00570 [Synergistales bacterium]